MFNMGWSCTIQTAKMRLYDSLNVYWMAGLILLFGQHSRSLSQHSVE